MDKSNKEIDMTSWKIEQVDGIPKQRNGYIFVLFIDSHMHCFFDRVEIAELLLYYFLEPFSFYCVSGLWFLSLLYKK